MSNWITNNSKVYYNGSIWESNKCGEFEIIGKSDRHRIDNRGYKEYKYYFCKFSDGTIVEAKENEIKLGKVRNPNFPSICGRGFLGEGKWKFYINQKATKEYSLFRGILNRCYNPNNPSYEYYGNKGVSLDSELFNFQNFCQALTRLQNYDKWKEDTIGIWQLDKDILCEKYKINPKIYSELTCQFITLSDNMSERNKRESLTGNRYLGISPNGECFEFYNIKEFSRKHFLYDTHVGRCLHGKAKTHKGWKFEIIPQNEILKDKCLIELIDADLDKMISEL